MTTFCLGISEFGMMGILENVADSLQISIVTAGHLISAYSLGVAIGAPGLILLRRWPMKRLLLMLVAIMCAGNICAALAPSYFMLLCSRFLSGLPHGAFFGAAAIVAERLAPEGKKAQAVAVMVGGMTIANVAGVPVATFLSNTLNWRLAFATVGLCGLAAFLCTRLWVPYISPLPDTGIKGQFRFLRNPGPWLVYSGVFFGQAAVYCWLSYISPIMTQVTHFAQADMTWIMIAVGLGMVIGNAFAGKLADRYPAALVRHNLRNSSCCDARHIFLLPIQNSVGNTRIHRAGMSVWHRGAASILNCEIRQRWRDAWRGRHTDSLQRVERRLRLHRRHGNPPRPWHSLPRPHRTPLRRHRRHLPPHPLPQIPRPRKHRAATSAFP